MCGNSEQPDSQHGDAHHGPDSDLHALFQRTEPADRPVHVRSLLSAVAARRRPGPTGGWRWSVAAVAAVAVLLASTSAGWWAGRRTAAAELAQVKADMAGERAELGHDITQLIQRTCDALTDAQQDHLKRVAVLLRDDYQTRIAIVNGQMDRLAMAVDRIDATSSIDADPLVPSSFPEN